MLELLLNAEVYAPEHLGRRHLLVAAGKIAWIGTDVPKLPASLGVSERDLGGKRVIPGLIDCHVHVTGGGGEAGPQTRVPPVPLSRFTAGGTTTVVGVLGTDDVTRDTASLLAATRALCAEGITAYCHTGGYHVPPVTLTGTVRGDIVHVDRIVGVGEIALSRGNLYELGGVKVLVDFAHNPHGMNALAVMAEALPAKRRLLVLGQAGDRDDVSIIEFARSAWRMKPDRTVLKEMEIYLRGRAKGEVTAMLKAELLRVGAPAESLVHADSEMEAARDALAWARPGDLLLMPIYAERAEVLALMERLIAERWSPGKPLP